MSGFFGFLSFAAFVCFIIGLVKPGIIIFWSKNKTRGKAWFYLIACIIFGIIAGAASGGTAVPTSKVAAVSSAVVSKAPAVKTWVDGQYKVGADVPDGEYVLISTNSIMSYVELAKDSTGTLASIITNDAFTNRSYVTVVGGQYLKITGCKMYALADAPKVDTSKGTLSSGMYKVGADLPAGEYSVTADAGAAAGSYIEVSKDSSHTLDAIVSNDMFTGSKYITVSNGQYLKLQGATIKLK
jgi:hypothetical protein